MTSNAKYESPAILVRDFVERAPAELELRIIGPPDRGVNERAIISERIQKLGLALAGFANYVHPGRVQIVGQSEISYLIQLTSEKRSEALRNFDLGTISCIVVTNSLEPPQELLTAAETHGLPLLQTPLVSSKAIGLITAFLQEELAPAQTVHGVLMEMYGIGVLLVGDSGIGKSECALDLLSHGHRLVSDDVVEIKRLGKILEGKAPELTFEHLEIHGLGILNIRELFGVSSVCEKIMIDLCIELKKWKEVDDIERIGLEMHEHDIFGVRFTKFILPVSSGRNLSTLVETAVRVYLLRKAGFNSVEKFIDKHNAMVGGAS
jgi:HPr kinase/phosphorylase